jgi:inorganic pyrophosphatase
MNFEITVIVEIPYASWYKYEVDKQTGNLVVDRPLPAPLPYNYGYVPNTLHADGDPLDVCIIGRYPIQPLSKIKVKLIGAFKCIDNGCSDDKLLAIVPGQDYSEGIDVEVVRHYLSTYKEGFTVVERVGAEEAYRILMQDVEAYLNAE